MSDVLDTEAGGLSVEHVTKGIGGRIILRDLTLHVPAGQFFVVEGENGSGKSTLLSIIAGLLEPDSGLVVLHGDVTEKMRLGYVPQVVSPAAHLSGNDLLTIAGNLYGLSAATIERRIAELTALIGLFQLSDSVSVYSVGMLKKLSFALAMMNKPQILLLDELLDSLDVECQGRISSFLRTECDSRRLTVVLVTHDRRAVQTLCDGCIRLQRNGGPAVLLQAQGDQELTAY